MEETKWLTKGKLLIIILSVLVVAGVVIGILIYRNNLKKEYMNFESQLEYAAPNYLLKEKITLSENEWREIDIDDILKQKLVINERASDCKGYVIAQAGESTNSDESDDSELSDENDDEAEESVDYEITYEAYIKCKNIYTTSGYGTKPSSGSENDEKTQSEEDTEIPEIELFGDETITLYVGEYYDELGAVATDNVDGDITNDIKITGEVDTDTVGTYIVTYTVKDSAGNVATKTRTIEVIEAEYDEEEEDYEEDYYEEEEETTTNYADTTAPIITFNNDSAYQTICTGNSVNISSNGPYGYVARDNVDGDITSKVTITGYTGVLNSPGVYTLRYSVTDSSGNKATATKTFTVKTCTSTLPSTVQTISVSSISCTTLNVSVNGQSSLTVSIYPSNATDQTVTYSSSNTSVATVSSTGVVKGISKGTAKITVTSSNNKSGWCNVYVK